MDSGDITTEMSGNGLVTYEAELPAEVSQVNLYLARIRPEWQAKNLIERVKVILPVDASSACQRLLNAAFHDLKKKVQIIGIDLAQDAAKSYKLPPIANDEDIEDYPTARLIDLAYRMGLVVRPEWRRLHRAYEIRRDLEHEDDEYEATKAELFYIFETAIDVALSKEPVQVIRLEEITDVVESDGPVSISDELVEDYAAAPPQRQTEILHKLAFWSLDPKKPELIRSNCFRLLSKFAPIAPPSSKISLAEQIGTRIGRGSVDIDTARVAVAASAFPFLRKRQQRALANTFVLRFSEVKPDWRQHPYHGELLDDFAGAGGFATCPPGTESRVIRWMVECYIGEPGRYGTFGRGRDVFNSDTAEPRIERILKVAPPSVKAIITNIASDRKIQRSVKVPKQGTRLSELVKLTSSSCLEDGN